MRNTRSNAVTTSSVAHPTDTSPKKSTRSKRRVSMESTNTISVGNRKRVNINRRPASRPVSSTNENFEEEDDEEDSESEEDEEDEEEEDDESDSEEIFNRLATRINTTRQGGPINQTNNPSPSEDDVDETNLPSIKEYKNELDHWPPARIAVVARAHKKKGTAVPPLILTEAKAIRKIYKHQKAMLSIMGNIITNIELVHRGELGGRRKPGCYQIWLKYSLERQKHKMPLKGGQKGILASRNRKLGKIWKALPDEHQEVFHPAVFYTLSGLSPPSSDSDLDEDDDNIESNKPIHRIDLEPAHREELQALYDKLVCKHKVAKEYAKVAAGIGQGPSLPDYNRQSLKSIERIHTQIENEANNMDFSYYLLACSTHASTEASSALPGWCREFTSHEEMALYVNTKSNFARVFAARAQGLSVAEVVAQTIGANVMTNTENARKTDPGDVVKADLAALLRSQFSALIGKEQGFPRAADPVSILRDDYNLKIIQIPGSKLPSSVLKLGFNKMNSRRSLWLEDLMANKFKMEKINTTPEEDIQGDEPGGEIEDQVTMTQDNHENADVMGDNFEDDMEDLEEEEEEEWNGFGDEDDSE
ncbi:uncharacterized protein MELLADRAFT_90958 [Melampsora larici-populina 98AG31]|uniref:Uncharacterized protein n=1 Tax=Melampsora larici-populina (strain 98AG31 / pathotype 3-4-7) TaxID=747676 RepID=F4R862_MELLP|nr:uncharacterized protein MELLADRAFT_90958 [Melampsora larici-populina 98AG31]EGG11668.1 hypothetical protein MELLADRAFT_90958 [Melampsora larici-populina 98AG31]